MASDPKTPVLRCVDLFKQFPTPGQRFWHVPAVMTAVNGVSLELAAGECLGLVGESGSGKSTLGRLLIRLHTPSAGTVQVHGVDITHLSGRRLAAARRSMQMVFQDPYSSLSPRFTVRELLAEPLGIHEPSLIGAAQDRKVLQLADMVGLARSALSKYPHQFSGGQRQRIAIARALAQTPEILICDEPIAALDVSIGAQILNLLRDLRAELGLSVLFISHQLAAVSYLADRIAVMQQGTLVEVAPTAELLYKPNHEYTKTLLAAHL